MFKTWRFFFLGLGLSLLSSHVVQAQIYDTVPAEPPVAQPSVKPEILATPQIITPEIKNLADIARDLKVASFKGKKFGRRIKVAVLDNVLTGHQDAIGKALPKDTVFHNGPASAADNDPIQDVHGVLMAKILVGVIKQSGADADYELHLFNTSGYTKFADAVETVIRDKFDVVLYSQVWQWAGNGDAKGFINTMVTKATDAGVIWVNAAGNFGKLLRRNAVTAKTEAGAEWVLFKDSAGKTETGAKVQCTVKASEKCTLKVILAWNDFKDDIVTGSDKDLDLFLVDKDGKIIKSSELHQKPARDLEDKQSTLLAREEVVAEVASGTYWLKVKINSKNFDSARDYLRLSFFGNGLTVHSPSEDENILPPADNANVLVIGASDDPNSSSSKVLKKPDLKLRSLVKLDNGTNPFSSSSAAAMAAGVAVLELGTGTEKTRAAVLAKLMPLNRKSEIPRRESAGPGPSVRRSPPQRNYPPRPSQDRYRNPDDELDTPAEFPNQDELDAPEDYPVARGLRPSAPNCVEDVHPNLAFPEARPLLNAGGVLTRGSGRLLIVVPARVLAGWTGLRGPYNVPLYMFRDGLRFIHTEEDLAFALARGIEVRPGQAQVCGFPSPDNRIYGRSLN